MSHDLASVLPMPRFVAEARDFNARVHIVALSQDYQWIGARGTRAYASPVRWIPEFHGDAMLPPTFEPTMDLSSSEAVSLMTALWDAGIRPKQLAADPRAEVAAIKFHLDDMRRLVFGAPLLFPAAVPTKERTTP